MKIALLAAWNEHYKPIAQITGPAMVQYCNRHGYDFHIGRYREDPDDLENYGDRGKIALYLEHYRNYDALMWLDIDVLIANPVIKIEDVMDRYGWPFLWTYDHNGPCSGFWIAKCIPEVAMMFNKVRNDGQISRSSIARMVENPKRVTIEFEPYGTSDQMLMRQLMSIPPYKQVLAGCHPCKEIGHCFDFRAMSVPEYYNDIGNYEEGDWLYTVPSLPLDRRIELLREKARLIYGPDYPGLRPDGDPAAGQPAAANP